MNNKNRIEKLIEAMKAAGYIYDDLESHDSYVHFFGEYSTMTFSSWDDLEDWLNGVVFDDPEESDRVEKILHPERFSGVIS